MQGTSDRGHSGRYPGQNPIWLVSHSEMVAGRSRLKMLAVRRRRVGETCEWERGGGSCLRMWDGV